MRNLIAVRYFRVFQLFAFVCVVALSLPVSAHESEIKISDPGFRPYSENTPAFLEALDTTTIAIYPSLVRRANRTAHSFASQRQIIAFLDAENIATAVAAPYRIDLGALPQVPQWDLFLNDMWRIAYLLTDHQFDAEYHLFMEFLLPVNNQAIFGIECYVLDRNGGNAFSFLLNSHHQLFVDAKLVADNSSEAARAKLLEKATQVGVTAFKRQLEQAKESATAATEKGPTDLRNGPSTEQDSCIGEAKSDYVINELPMYGHLKKTAVQKRADNHYIKTMTKEGRSRADAADSAARVAWNTCYAGDCSTAIKRFNHAWLLDPDNQLALWGFAVICLHRDQVEEAVRYFQMAIENGPEQPSLRRDYEHSLNLLKR